MKLTYKLTKEELGSYYKKMLEDDDSVFKFRWRLRLIMPAAIIILTFIVNKGILSWLLAAAVCGLWIWIADDLLYPKYEKRVIGAYLKKTDEFQNLEVEITEQVLKVNNAVLHPVSCIRLENMILIISDRQTNLLIPDRVLDKDQSAKIESSLTKLMKDGGEA